MTTAPLPALSTDEQRRRGDVQPSMKQKTVVVPWRGGMHMRPASALVKLAQRSRSQIMLKLGNRYADARNIIAILTLCASMGSIVTIEVTGDDESDTAVAVEHLFNEDSDRIALPPEAGPP